MMTGQEDIKVMNPDCPVIYTSLSVSIINNSVVISHPKVYIFEYCHASVILDNVDVLYLEYGMYEGQF